jgi:preprotein translocase SecE subunit
MFIKTKKFVGEVVGELKKVAWLTRKELLEVTWVVLISSILLGVFIGSTDFVLSKLLQFIIR